MFLLPGDVFVLPTWPAWLARLTRLLVRRSQRPMLAGPSEDTAKVPVYLDARLSPGRYLQ